MTNETTFQDLDFFRIACGVTARYAVDALRLAMRKVTPRIVVAMLTSAPRDWREASSLDHSEDSFCRQCLADAAASVAIDGSAEDHAALHAVRRHFLDDLPALSPASRKLLEDAFVGIHHGMHFVPSSVIAAKAVGNRGEPS
jgi:hypothetical protein